MMNRLRRFTKNSAGFTMIELMVVVIIVGVLAAIAVPIYADYVLKARTSEATARMADILTAAKAYAQEFGTWPSSATPVGGGFIGDVSASPGANGFTTYTVAGTALTSLTITTAGKGNCAQVTEVKMTCATPQDNGIITITGL